MEGALKHTLNDDVEYLFLNKKRTLDFKALKKLSDFIKKHKINVVHAHSTSYFFATLLKLINRKIIVIWHDHNGNRQFSSKSHNSVLRSCSYFFNKIITVNEDLKLWSEQNTFTKEIYCLPNFSVLKSDEKQVTNLKGNIGNRIVCLANLRHPKNHIFLLKAFFKATEFMGNWSLHLIGKNFNDAYSNELDKFIDSHNLQDKVFVYGQKQDVNYILNQGDIGVLTSSSEGLPLTLLEYGLAKLPIVATNVGDCNKVITNKSEGQLVNSQDAKAFSKALLLYMNNSELRKQHGEGVYNNVETNFSARKAITQLISIYKS